MRILITGSSGFIARRLARSGLDLADALGVDLANGQDICDAKVADRIRDFDPEVVFHLAAHHFIPWCNEHPDEVVRANVSGTGQVLHATGPSLQTVVFASSAAVYGFDPHPIRESHGLDGEGVYAWSKKMGESLLSLFAKRHPDVRCVAARLFNAVGAGDGHAHVLPKIIAGLRGSRAVTLGNAWPKRDFVHVDDIADALVFLANHAPPRYSVFNVGTGIATSVGELADLVCEVDGATTLPAEADIGRHDDGDLVSDPTALAQLGWGAQRTLRDAVREALEATPVSEGS